MEESIISALHNNDIEQKRKKQLVTPTMNTKVHRGKKKEKKEDKKKRAETKKEIETVRQILGRNSKKKTCLSINA